MKGLNKVTLIGNLGKDPEMRQTNSGDPVVNFSIACSETWRDKNTGEQREKTEWINIVIFGKVAEIANQYLKKGSRCYLEGSLQTRKWQDQSGNDRWTTEVVLKPFNGSLLLLDSKDQRDGASSNSGTRVSSGPAQQEAPARQQQKPAFNDDIPF